MDEHTTSIAFAYGLLWHVVTPDQRINQARRMLCDRLTDAERAAGIMKAKKAGCVITTREVACIEVDIDAEATRRQHKPEPNFNAALRALRIAGTLRDDQPTPLGLAR